MFGELYYQRIQTGDVVTLYYMDSSPEAAIVVTTPGGAGGLWQFKRKDGTVFALNPYSSHFIRMERAPEPAPAAAPQGAEAGVGDGEGKGNV